MTLVALICDFPNGIVEDLEEILIFFFVPGKKLLSSLLIAGIGALLHEYMIVDLFLLDLPVTVRVIEYLEQLAPRSLKFRLRWLVE